MVKEFDEFGAIIAAVACPHVTPTYYYNINMRHRTITQSTALELGIVDGGGGGGSGCSYQTCVNSFVCVLCHTHIEQIVYITFVYYIMGIVMVKYSKKKRY